MAFVFDATISGTSSNSFVTLEEANDYFETKLNSDEWDCLTDTQKQAILVQSTRRINSESFKGQKTNLLQSLEWPRNFIYDKDGFTISSLVIPKELIWATCELVDYYLKEDTREITNSMMEDASRVKIGPIEYDIRATRTGDKLPQIVQMYLKGIGSAWITNKFPSSLVR